MKRYIGWGPEHRSFCALRVGMHHSSGAWMSSPAWELFKLRTIGFYGGFIMWADLSTPCLALFPLWKMGVGLKIPSLSSWLGLSDDHPPPSRSPPRGHLITIKDTAIRGYSKGFRNSVRNYGQRPTIRTRDAPGVLIAQVITRVSRALCQEPETETNIHLFCLPQQTSC